MPEDRLEQYGDVLSTIITQLIRSLERRPEMHTPAGKKQPQVLLMLDEFPRLGKIEVIASAVSTLRSKKVTIFLAMQSLAQLDLIYGEETRRIILESCAYQALLRGADVVARKYFSELIGTIKIQNRSRSASYDINNKKTGYSEQISNTDEPAIKPHEFGTLEDIVLVTSDVRGGFCRLKKELYHESPEDTPPRPKGFFGKLRSFAEKVVNKIKSCLASILTRKECEKCVTISATNSLPRQKKCVNN